jgi:hypothetical protein
MLKPKPIVLFPFVSSYEKPGRPGFPAPSNPIVLSPLSSSNTARDAFI